MIYGFKETAVVLEHMISGVVQGYRNSTGVYVYKHSTQVQEYRRSTGVQCFSNTDVQGFRSSKVLVQG